MFKQRSLCRLIAATFLCATAFIPPVTAGADSPDGLSLTVTPSTTMASLGDNISYNYMLTNTYNTAVSSLELTDSKFGPISLPTTSLAAGASLTASKTYTVLSTDPNPLTNNATATAILSTGEIVTATSPEVSVTINRTIPSDNLTPPSNNRTKADILRERGVPGKGISHAPGLQKPFNWNLYGWGPSIGNKIRHHDNNNDNESVGQSTGIVTGQGKSKGKQ